MFSWNREGAALRDSVDDLARSYLRGSAYGSPEGRAVLVNSIKESARRLRQQGDVKAIERARRVRPAFLSNLPRERQNEFHRLIQEALD